MTQILTIVLAGGKGERLQPLTNDRAKPAVPFAGVYRIIDFTLSNCVNSGLRQILVMTQYKSQSLDRHVRLAWNGFHREWGEFLEIVPPQHRVDQRWYEGTADAVYQNFYALERTKAEHVLILSGDHIYKMDYRPLLQDHIERHMDATIACVPVPLRDGSSFGIMRVDDDCNVLEFQEKPARPDPLPGDPRHCLASMGVYVFRTKFLLEQLCRDGADTRSRHDFGHSIVPSIIGRHRVRAFPFRDPQTGDRAYWRDVGTIDAYYDANMELLSEFRSLNLHDRTWPIHTYVPPAPPASVDVTGRILFSPSCRVRDVLMSPGAIITGANVRRSILSPQVVIERKAEVSDSILLDSVQVGESCRLHRAIIDKQVRIPAGTVIGENHRNDRARGFTVTESGLVIVPKDYSFATDAADTAHRPLDDLESFSMRDDSNEDDVTAIKPRRFVAT